jgi:hypothetical protein
MPMDPNRFEQFKKVKKVYDSFPQEKEFLIPTRNANKVIDFLRENGLTKDVRVVPYTVEKGFNPSLALNLGVLHAQYETVIITSPEVMPTTDVLNQFSELEGKNVLAQVFDTDKDNNITISLINSRFRNDSPGIYFLAMFNKQDIEKINGFDLAFMDGYAWEDTDFGNRWVRASIPFEIHDEIQGVHLYHERSETIPDGWNINAMRTIYNNNNHVVIPERGLKQCQRQFS